MISKALIVLWTGFLIFSAVGSTVNGVGLLVYLFVWGAGVVPIALIGLLFRGASR